MCAENAKDILKSVPFGDMLEAIRKEGKETTDKDEGEDESEESYKGSSSNDKDDDETRKEKLRLKQLALQKKQKQAEREKGTLLGHYPDGTGIYSKGLPMELAKKIKAFAQDAANSVDRDCTFVSIGEEKANGELDGEVKEDDVTKVMKTCKMIGYGNRGPAGGGARKRRGVFYEVQAGGQSLTNPSSNPPNFRKEDLETLFRG